MNDVDFKTLLGKTCEKIQRIELDDDNNGRIIFTTICGDDYHLYHEQDCCEDVRIKDICGNLDDLIGAPILEAEEVTNDKEHDDEGTSTWTFYKLATIKGSVTINFLGVSNGFYCESISFGRTQKQGLLR